MHLTKLQIREHNRRTYGQASLKCLVKADTWSTWVGSSKRYDNETFEEYKLRRTNQQFVVKWHLRYGYDVNPRPKKVQA